MKIPVPDAVHLLHEAPFAVLATHSLQMPGFPYATTVPLVVDEWQRPLLLISALAEHTRNLLADARASVAVTEAGVANVQNAERMTLVGSFERFEPTPALVARYLRYQPEAEQYLALDFSFFRMRVERVRYIGGVGRMGWLDGGEWQAIRAVAPEEESRLIAGSRRPEGQRLLGVDAYGYDYVDASGQHRSRFDAPLGVAELAARLAAG